MQVLQHVQANHELVCQTVIDMADTAFGHHFIVAVLSARQVRYDRDTQMSHGNPAKSERVKDICECLVVPIADTKSGVAPGESSVTPKLYLATSGLMVVKFEPVLMTALNFLPSRVTGMRMRVSVLTALPLMAESLRTGTIVLNGTIAFALLGQ